MFLSRHGIKADLSRIKPDGSCLSCVYESARRCHKFGAEVIPQGYIDKGCDAWCGIDEVPF